MRTFELVIEWKLNWLGYASDITCHPLGDSKCNQVCDTDSYNKQPRKSTNFKLKAPSFYTTEVSYTNFFSKKIDQTFGFWAGQSLELKRNTYFRGIKFCLVVNFYVTKLERLTLSKMWTSALCLSKGSHTITTSDQSAWENWVKF